MLKTFSCISTLINCAFLISQIKLNSQISYFDLIEVAPTAPHKYPSPHGCGHRNKLQVYINKESFDRS